MDDSSHLIIGHVSRRELRQLFSKILIDRARLYKGTPCWTWTAYTARGYGQITWRGQVERPHRVLYAWIVNPLPRSTRELNGKLPEIDHLCRNRACCNPLHLELVSRRVNMERSPLTRHGAMTHCERGHLYTPETIRWGGPNNRGKVCLACEKERNKEKWNKVKASPELQQIKSEKAKIYRSTPEYRARFAAYMRERRRSSKSSL